VWNYAAERGTEDVRSAVFYLGGLKYTGYAVLYDALGSRLTRGEWIEISRIAGFALSNSGLPTRGKMGLNKRHIIRDSGASHRYNNGWVHALRH